MMKGWRHPHPNEKGVTVTWIGQSFALSRCSASSENRPRTRRTKEERRTMVMSFIKKYQISNNGKFPSLNLTQKEVGGSFYTIREIVRDIIQENKVLGPGSPSSKLLNLEYFSEEEGDKVSFLDAHNNVSISAIVDGIDEEHHHVASSIDQKISRDENIMIVKPVTLVLSNTQLNEYSSRRLLQNEPSIQEKFPDGIVLHEVAKTGAESKIHVLTEKKDDSVGGGHQINAEIQPSNPENMCIQYGTQSAPLYTATSGTSFVETEVKNEDMHNKIHEARCFLKGRIDSSEGAFADSLTGTNMFCSDRVDDQSNYLSKHQNGEVFALGADNLGQDSSSEIPVLDVSNAWSSPGVVIKCLTSEPLEEDAVINNSEFETAGLNRTKNIFILSESSSIANKGVMPFILYEKEQITSDAETWGTASLNERKNDVAEGRIVDNLVLQTISCSASGVTEDDIHLADKSSSFVDTIKESENASSKLLMPTIQEAGHSESKAEKYSFTSSTTNDKGFISSSNEKAGKEPEITQTNPVWAAINLFVSSFIKFWSE